MLVVDTRSMLGAEKTMGRLQEAMGTIQAMLAGLPAADEFVALWMEVRHASPYSMCHPDHVWLTANADSDGPVAVPERSTKRGRRPRPVWSGR
jgi:hypothetical protein